MKYFILTALTIAACSSPAKPPTAYTFLCVTAAGPAQFSVPSDDTKETDQFLFITQPDKELRIDKSMCIRVEEK
jgi:hypothetical protein